MPTNLCEKTGNARDGVGAQWFASHTFMVIGMCGVETPIAVVITTC